jgi:hypothetical protein
MFMSYIYAQIDENNICLGVSDLAGEKSEQNLVRIENLDSDLIGKKYVDGQWLQLAKAEIEEPITPEPTQLDRIEAAINMKNNEISERAIDTYTKQLLENGLL